MTQTLPDQIIGGLQSAVQSGQLPFRQRAHGTEILAHLTSPVQVVVLGRPNSGKTTLINMLLGGEYLCLPPEMESAEVVHGTAPRVTLRLRDGRSQSFGGTQIPASALEAAQNAVIELPLEGLKTTSYCEVSLPAEPTQQYGVLQDALAHGQVFIWCSEAFDAEEQRLWQTVPDTVKDHSFLALTKADRHIMKGDLAGRMQALESAVADAFWGLHPVATLHALKAQVGPGEAALWEASGGRSLRDALHAKVQKGRAADLDQAMVLLAQFGKDGQTVAHPPQRSDARPAPALQQAADKPTLMGRLQEQLQLAAQEMLDDLDAGKIPDTEGLLTRCSATLNALTKSLSKESAQDPEAAEVLADAQDGEETLMLLQVEQSPTAAEDAVVVLLQLKKEMGARALA